MLTRRIFFVAILCIFKTSYASRGHSSALYEVLASTTKFFSELRDHYVSQPATPGLLKSIDESIDAYEKKVKNLSNPSRGKRKLDADNDIRIFEGFYNVPALNISGAVDVSFFVHRVSLRPYAVTLTSSGITLLQYQNGVLFQVAHLNLENGIRVTSQSTEEATLLFVQRSTNNSLVVRFYETNNVQPLQCIQHLHTPNAIYSSLWEEMNQIYLAVASSDSLAVFTWLGEHFDNIQTKKFGSSKLVPFQTGSSMYLLAMSERRTLLLKFLLHSKEFTVVQKFNGAKDATFFHAEKEHSSEDFLALAGKRSTIIYKQARHRFVPFQEISFAEKIHSLEDGDAVLLMSIKNQEISFHQYDGWKFVESRFRESGIIDALPVSLEGEEILAVKKKNFHLKIDSNYYTGGDSKTIVDFGANTWNFRKIRWRRKKSSKNSREDIKDWCHESLQKTKRLPATVPEFENTLRIHRGQIKNLRVNEVNGYSAENFSKLAERWSTIVSETRVQENSIKYYVSTVNPVFNNFRAGNVVVNCTRSCKASKIESSANREFSERLRRLDNANQNLIFEKVKVSFTKNLPCPVPDPKIREVTVFGLVNGISFNDFAEDVLKVTGDQLLNGSYEFSELHVENAEIPLKIAWNHMGQEIHATTIEVEELYLSTGDFLLPLNGTSSILTGSLTVPKARIEGLMALRARPRGPGAEMLKPVIYVTEPLELSKNISLNNVKIVERLIVKDLTRSQGKSFNEILSNALPIDSTDIPVHFKFRGDKVSWKNMSLKNFPYKWVTKKQDHVVISGTKHATKPIITLGDSVYKYLPTPRLPIRLCSVNITSEGIWESNLTIDNGKAKTVKTVSVYENSGLSKFFNDSATCLEDISWEKKKLTGRVIVKKANIGSISGMDYQGLKDSMEKWVQPGCLKGPLKVSNLRVNELITTNDFVLSLPREVGNVVSLKNIYVERLNGYDFNQFLDNIVNVDEKISLTNVTFAGGFTAIDTFAKRIPFSLQENLTFRYFGSKEILGSLESQAMIVPHVLEFTSEQTPVNIIANGNVEFWREPKITKINQIKLEWLYNEVWLTDRATDLWTESILFENVIFKNNLTILKSFNTPNLGRWESLENRLLSKTKSQEISVSATFGSVETPNVIGAAKSHLRSNITNLKDLEDKSVKKNSEQAIQNSWEFEELIVTGIYEVNGLINGLNFAKDVVRDDVKKNIVTGKKIVAALIAENINGVGFDTFARNTLKRNNGNRTILIRGSKSFKSLEMQHTRVEGTIFGRKTENLLLKSKPQNLRGPKLIQGSLTTSAVMTNGTVNGIHLKYLVEWQLKKKGLLQIVESPMLLANSLTILGNVTIDGLYHGVDLRDFKSVESSFGSMLQKTSEVVEFAEAIDVALANRAVFFDKLELVEKNSTALIRDPVTEENVICNDLGECRLEETTLYCNDQKIFDTPSTTGSHVLTAKIFSLSGIPLVVSVNSDPEGGVSIFRWVSDKKSFERFTDYRIPGIIEASVTRMEDSVWISIRQPSSTIILRYESWGEIQKWILPGGEPFVMSSAPTEELLLTRSDGVWRLGGLGGPRHIFSADLNGQIDSFSFGPDYYVQLSDNNVTSLLKARYIGY